MDRDSFHMTISEVANRVHLNEQLIALCSNDANLVEVDHLIGNRLLSSKLFKACALKTIDGNCECGKVSDRTIPCDTKIAAPSMLDCIMRHNGSNSFLWDMIQSSTCIKVAQIFASKVDEHLCPDDFDRFTRFQVEAMLNSFRRTDLASHRQLLIRAFELGSIYSVLKHCTRNVKLLKKLINKSMRIDVGLHRVLTKMLADMEVKMDLNDYEFELDCNPWVVNEVVNTVGPEYLNIVSDHIVEPMDEHDADGDFTRQQFLIRCAFVVELASSCRRWVPVHLLQEFVQQFYDHSSLFPESHWIRNFESNKVAAIQTLNSCLPRDLVGLVLSYLVGDAE